jgi:hypothetical protein
MARTRSEREDDKREERLEQMREQISSGELVVRQMTPSERKRWQEHSAAFDDQATPEQRTRRDASRQAKHEKRQREQKRRDARPPR